MNSDEHRVRAALAALEHSMRLVPAGSVTIRDAGTTQKLSPTSPQQPFFSHDARQPRRAPRVVAVQPFLLDAVPVTNALYALGDAPGDGGGEVALPDHPRTHVSWLDAVAFCNRLSTLAGLPLAYRIDGEDVAWDLSAAGFRLPTEAEWQRACVVDGVALDETVWFKDNSGDAAHQVGLKRANSLGLHDMLGNVWEWCWDLFDEEVYGSYRVFRGGGFADDARTLRPETRRKSHPTYRIEDVGFRVARNS